jgi:ribokinase
MERKKLIVVGSYIVALVMDTDRIPLKGETLTGRNFRQTFGGKGSNQAIQAARLEVEVGFVGKIGADNFGRDFINLCQKEGVNYSYVFTHEELPTASGFIICAEGHNIITIDRGALNEFGKTEIDQALELFNPQSIVLIQLEIPLDTAFYAAKKAKERGAIVILNPAPAMDLTKINLSFIDYLTPNETEARICAGLEPDDIRKDIEVGDILLNLGLENLIITLGEKGSLLINKKEKTLIPAFKIPKVVDSTGAGDAFNAGFAVAISEGWSMKDAILFGNAAGALTCTKADTIPAFHTREEIILFMKQFDN